MMETLAPNKIFASILLSMGKDPNRMRKQEGVYKYGNKVIFYPKANILTTKEHISKYMGWGYERLTEEKDFLITILPNKIQLKQVKTITY
ncbi:hypothetical protein BKH46_06000 [Helicobacter sp. 12S02634-8]|uniref:hypothetical protein n=1 Tax=Helicobacter sp. 12S02634-8 TaxID=1476199 RepID=UPI000BA56573|nr:hypothetical protein [Helicobacter sp. 12S02634-8]PAF46772.1 hypothetical protein BKH46_06000 [Helicobacter sp. 12S02634-8]